MRKYLIVVPFLLAVFLTHPFENVFYGGDDWAYAWPIRSLLTGGKLILSHFSFAPAIPQILYATFVSHIFGFSFRNLNLSIIIIGLIGVIVSYNLMKDLGIKDRSAALGAMFMSITPLYIGLTASFMSDMTYTVLMLVACLEYVRGLNLCKVKHVLFAGILSAAAFLSRQIGFSLVIAFLLATFVLIHQRKLQVRKGLYFALAGGIIPVLLFIAYFMFPDFFGGYTGPHTSSFYQMSLSSVLNLQRKIANFFRFCNYMVILLFPLYFVLFWERRKQIYEVIRSRFKTAVFFMFLYFIIAFTFIIKNKPLTIDGDLFHTCFIWPDLMATRGQALLWNALVLVSSIPASILFCLILERLKMVNIKEKLYVSIHPRWIFLAVTIFIQGVLTHIYVGFYNSYFLPLLVLLVPFLIKLFDYFSVKPSFIFTFLVLIAAITMSVGFIEPHHSYSEASWKEADRLVISGIDSRKIYTVPSWYAWNNHDFFEKRNQNFSVFMKNNSSYLISELPLDKLSGNFYHLKAENAIYYRTLLGRRSLYVYSYTHSN